MQTTTYVKLEYGIVVRDSSLAIRELINWFCSREDIVEGFGAIEGDGDKYKENPALMRQAVAQIVPPVIQNDPRKLYEFLDDHKIRISIAEHPDSTDEAPLFTYHNSVEKQASTASTRYEAEESAFYAALRLLHKKIESGNKT